MNKKSGKAILFLYEGDTEQGFYDSLFEKLGIDRNVQIKKKCLDGVFSINKKVANAVDNYLESDANKHVKKLTVFVAYDREGKRDEPVEFNAELIRKKAKNARLGEIHEIIATQMLESWFFIDIDNIYKFLKVEKSKRNAKKFAQHENFVAEHLDTLFRQHDPKKRYYKGERTANFIEHLDVIKIYRNCNDLKTGMDKILSMCNIKPPVA